MKVLSALESSDGLKRDKFVQWSDCGTDNATVRWEDFQVIDPIRMEKLALGARYRILEEVQTGSYSKVEVWRVLNLFILPVYVKIPCIGKFGSCNYDICRVWDRDNFCNFQRVNNASCGCPMKPGVVEGYDFKARIPEKKITTYQSMFARVSTQSINFLFTKFTFNLDLSGFIYVEMDLVQSTGRTHWLFGRTGKP